MPRSTSHWIPALALVGYALGCLVLALWLAHHPLEEHPIPVGNTPLPDLNAITHIPERKAAFIDLLMPMIEARNQSLLSQRQELLAMADKLQRNRSLSRRERARLKELRQRYHVDEERYLEMGDALEELLRRIDVIPPSLVLAQAAAESGWGTSRFAREGNNLFGQWCYSEGCGMIPARRPTGNRHEVQRFDNVEAAVIAYYRNLNTHRAYRDFREQRARMRRDDQPLSGHELAGQLRHYSSRGQDYIDELRELIRFNGWE